MPRLLDIKMKEQQRGKIKERKQREKKKKKKKTRRIRKQKGVKKERKHFFPNRSEDIDSLNSFNL